MSISINDFTSNADLEEAFFNTHPITPIKEKYGRDFEKGYYQDDQRNKFNATSLAFSVAKEYCGGGTVKSQDYLWDMKGDCQAKVIDEKTVVFIDLEILESGGQPVSKAVFTTETGQGIGDGSWILYQYENGEWTECFV